MEISNEALSEALREYCRHSTHGMANEIALSAAIKAYEATKTPATVQPVDYSKPSGMAYRHLSDKEMADKVRMLMRGDLDHEAVCVGARDRIMHLSEVIDILRQPEQEGQQPVEYAKFDEWFDAQPDAELCQKYSAHYYLLLKGWKAAMLIKREAGDVVSALHALTRYVQEQAAANNLDWGVLAKNQVLVNALIALGEIKDDRRRGSDV